MTAMRFPISFNMEATALLVWDLPDPVRAAHTAMTGLLDRMVVFSWPSSMKLAPAATVLEARCITFSWRMSEYENTTMSTSFWAMISSRSSSGRIGMPSG